MQVAQLIQANARGLLNSTVIHQAACDRQSTCTFQLASTIEGALPHTEHVVYAKRNEFKYYCVTLFGYLTRVCNNKSLIVGTARISMSRIFTKAWLSVWGALVWFWDWNGDLTHQISANSDTFWDCSQTGPLNSRVVAKHRPLNSFEIKMWAHTGDRRLHLEKNNLI